MHRQLELADQQYLKAQHVERINKLLVEIAAFSLAKATTSWTQVIAAAQMVVPLSTMPHPEVYTSVLSCYISLRALQTLGEPRTCERSWIRWSRRRSHSATPLFNGSPLSMLKGRVVGGGGSGGGGGDGHWQRAMVAPEGQSIERGSDSKKRVRCDRWNQGLQSQTPRMQSRCL